MTKEYTIISQRPTVELDRAGMPAKVVEILFTWGDNFLGSIRVNEHSATKESIKTAIHDYMSRFDLSE